MGIESASEIFTEKIREMLSDLPGQLNMTDDILVFGKTREQHQTNLLALLKRLEQSGLTLNMEKSEFYKNEHTFYGLKFSSTGVSPTMHSFPCSVTWSSRFMRNLCTMAEPLWILTKSAVKWKWGDIGQRAFEDIKQSISTKCIGFFKKDCDTSLTVDASPVGLGAVLHQFNPYNPIERQIVNRGRTQV